MTNSIAGIRKDYSIQSLSEQDMAPDPIRQFQKWFSEAVNSEVTEVNAMTLATCTKEARPDARIVLLKGVSDEGFAFFTNYESRKAKEIHENPFVCLVFFWKELERQVRIEGTVKVASEAINDEYFSQRPAKSQISAWSSPQSQVIKDRSVLEENVAKYEQQFLDKPVSRPQFWGGYVVSPVIVEFWQGRRSRLHDRIRYTSDPKGWKIERLAP